MEVENISLENLRIQHAHLDAVIKEEESHIWKNCIKIEELKKQKLRKKMKCCAELCKQQKLNQTHTFSKRLLGKEQPFFNGYLNTPMLH